MPKGAKQGAQHIYVLRRARAKGTKVGICRQRKLKSQRLAPPPKRSLNHTAPQQAKDQLCVLQAPHATGIGSGWAMEANTHLTRSSLANGKPLKHYQTVSTERPAEHA